MNEIALLQNYLIVGGLLFGVGLVGLMARRNLIVMFLAAELMLQGVSLSLVAWGRYHTMSPSVKFNHWSKGKGRMQRVFNFRIA